MKSKTLKAVLLVSLFFNFFILAGAGYFLVKDGRCRIWQDRPSQRRAALMEKLNLSLEQQKAMEAADGLFRKNVDGARKELAAKRTLLFTLIKADSPDRAAIQAAITNISALQGKIEGHVVEHIINEKAALNKEQQEIYLKHLEKRFNRVRHRDMRPGHIGPDMQTATPTEER